MCRGGCPAVASGTPAGQLLCGLRRSCSYLRRCGYLVTELWAWVPREEGVLLFAVSCYSALGVGLMGTWDRGGARPSWKGWGGSSPCPHTLSWLLATSESTLVLLFPGKTKWADHAGPDECPHGAVLHLAPRRGRERAGVGFLGKMSPATAKSHSAGCSLRGVPSNGDHVSPNLGLLDWQEPAANNLPEKN